MGVRSMPYFDAEGKPQFAGMGSGGGSGGPGYTLPIASDSTLGGVKIGSGVNVASDGTISVNGINLSTTESIIGKIGNDDLYGVVLDVVASSGYSASDFQISFPNVKWIYHISTTGVYASGSDIGIRVLFPTGVIWLNGTLSIGFASSVTANAEHPMKTLLLYTKTN